MPAGRAAACTLVVLALALGGSACGDSQADKRAAASLAQANARWRAGFARWHRQMLASLNGMSLVFSNAQAVGLLESADPRMDARIARFETTLTGCSLAVKRLGPPPAELVDAQARALQACANLETGSRLVKNALEQLRHGLGVGAFDRVTEPLSTGQDEMSVAAREVRLAQPP